MIDNACAHKQGGFESSVVEDMEQRGQDRHGAANA